jgi:hypothetical protein
MCYKGSSVDGGGGYMCHKSLISSLTKLETPVVLGGDAPFECGVLREEREGGEEGERERGGEDGGRGRDCPRREGLLSFAPAPTALSPPCLRSPSLLVPAAAPPPTAPTGFRSLDLVTDVLHDDEVKARDSTFSKSQCVFTIESHYRAVTFENLYLRPHLLHRHLPT